MRREELVDLSAFLTVAEERSVTRAAAKLGTSQSSLSHTTARYQAGGPPADPHHPQRRADNGRGTAAGDAAPGAGEHRLGTGLAE
ncbi:putative transcriptional regulator, LysR family [Bosea sp. LC85]|nr:putative transcriptional regulator, LysR family [Bosea sp. LC85]